MCMVGEGLAEPLLVLHCPGLPVDALKDSDDLTEDEAVDEGAAEHREEHVEYLPRCDGTHVTKADRGDERQDEVTRSQPLDSRWFHCMQHALPLLYQPSSLDPGGLGVFVQGGNKVPSTSTQVDRQAEERQEVDNTNTAQALKIEPMRVRLHNGHELRESSETHKARYAGDTLEACKAQGLVHPHLLVGEDAVDDRLEDFHWERGDEVDEEMALHVPPYYSAQTANLRAVLITVRKEEPQDQVDHKQYLKNRLQHFPC
mmetsp:Transcript_220/g.488  ORF Transcript_220/g.488 Transcript_220/m.488 type:complete len:258 (+) Transcript_220:1214-1987(+)